MYKYLKMEENCNKKLNTCDFEKELVFTDQQPSGFEAWTEGITYDECKYILPDGSTGDLKAFVNNQKVFDSGAFTNHLLIYYNEL